MKPNTYCLGFPKCGTTSLANWLDMSPDVFMPKVKEPGFFVKNDPNAAVKSEAAYNALYYEAKGFERTLDFTTTYIYEDGVIEMLADDHDTKFIAVLRHPAKAALSMYHFNNRLGGEVDSYRQAIEDEPLRIEGHALPTVARRSGMPLIRVCYKTQFQYDSWLGNIPTEIINRSYLVTMEALLACAQERKNLCNFLGIDQIHAPLPKSNQFAPPSRSKVKQFVAFPPWPLNLAKNFIKNRLDIADTNIMRAFYASGNKNIMQQNDYEHPIDLYDIENMKLSLSRINVHGLDYWR